MRIVQLSDLHLRPPPLYSGIDPWAAWRAALARALALRPAPELLLLSGDLADDGGEQSYRDLAADLAACGIAYAVLPGNHDCAPLLRRVFAEQPWSHPSLACQRRDFAAVTLLLVDTTIAGEEAGRLTAEHLAWLERHCPDDRRCLLVLHHPPFMIGIPGMDCINCAGGALLADWLAGRPQIEALLCGHVHRPVTTLFAGRPALTAPATVHQIALSQGPLAWTAEPPGMLVHDLVAGQPLRSHYLPVAAAPVVAYDD